MIAKILVVLLLVFMVISFNSCATTALVKIKCPPDPNMRSVEVRGGKIQGESLTNTKLNHIKLWKHIHILKLLGCKASISHNVEFTLPVPKYRRYFCLTIPFNFNDKV